MTDVFISYAREDRPRIDRLAAALAAEGLDVWWDRNIAAGTLFSKETETRLYEAKVVVVAWSRASLESLWVADEASVGRDKGNLVPIALDGVDPPLGFRQIHTIDFSGWSGAASDESFMDLLRSVRGRIDGTATAIRRPVAAAQPAQPAVVARRRWALLAGAVALIGAVLAAALLRPSSPVVQDRSIAVLPFADMTSAGDQQYFADGLAEEILNILARSPDIKVAGRTSSFQFKGRADDLREIGRSLGVAHILEGSVRKSGERVRVTAQLIRASDGFHLWSETYDRQLTDVFAVQEDIAVAIAQKMAAPLGIEPGTQARDRTSNPEAYDHYLRGLALFSQRADIEQAGRHFERAVALDPGFAAAWAGLADVYIAVPSWLDQYGGEPTNVAVFQRRAERAATRALQLNPNIAATHHALSVVYRDRWQWAQAEDAIERAVELAPGAPVYLEDYQEFLENTGRWQESAAAIARAVEIEPRNAFYHAISGIALWHLREYDRAIASMRHALQLDPGLESFHVEFAALLLDAGRSEEAAAYVEGCTACEPAAREFMRRAIRHVRSPSGRFEYTDALRYTFGDYVFRYLVGGEELVLDALERAAREGELVPLGINPRAIAAVRPTPRYRELVRAVGLDDYWRERGWPEFCQPVGTDDFDCR